jgi:hypothetical protein
MLPYHQLCKNSHVTNLWQTRDYSDKHLVAFRSETKLQQASPHPLIVFSPDNGTGKCRRQDRLGRDNSTTDIQDDAEITDGV